LYLDSSDNPQDTLDQSDAATLHERAVVVVDDAQVYNGMLFGKATLLYPRLRERGAACRLYVTEKGFLMLVAVFGWRSRRDYWSRFNEIESGRGRWEWRLWGQAVSRKRLPFREPPIVHMK
jgi:hypothetical protein